jgi:hypothetical protein
VSDVVGDRVRQVRRRQQMTAVALALRCAELGMPQLSASAIYNMETGRRDKSGRRRREITVDELFTLALALNVWPVHLLVPPDEGEKPYQIAPQFAEDSWDVRRWVRGYWVPAGGDGRWYGVEMPAGEHGKWIGGVQFPAEPWDESGEGASNGR